MANLRGGTTIGGYTVLHSGLDNAYLGGNLNVEGKIDINNGLYINGTRKDLTWDAAQKNQTVTAGSGMNFTATSGNVTITMGTPSTLTASTTNSASGTTHTHAITGFSTTDHSHANDHVRSHAITSTSDHTATAWRLFYSNASGQVAELGLGTSGQVLKSNGAAAAPSWQTDNNDNTATAASDILEGSNTGTQIKYSPYSAKGAGHLYTGTTNPTATNRLNYDGYLYATQLFDNGKRVSTTDHSHTNDHARSHTMTSTSDHTSTAWRLFYSNGSGQVNELALGTSGQVLKSNGASAAPSWLSINTMKYGTGTFAGPTEVTIAHGLGAVPSHTNVTPITNPGGYLGEVWVRSDATNLYIGNSGSFRGSFNWLAIL